ncbi:hypothetical protein GDO86_012671 [Hymenochirus boettgeri]|uniref:Cilia- and flagella-associated protein 74 n=1 Tax=Hymenochirus boettgeri TaxID=247094 RepID=A0A8T2IRH7_9PIPI|nr:hypothetical protein GDO86_012671 [Hymenochirus boettgeri]
MLEKDSVLASGGDVTKYFIHQKRIKEFEKKKQEFEEQQKIRKQEIISRILQEEAIQEKQKKRSFSVDVSKCSLSTKLRSKTMQYIESVVMKETAEELETKKNWHPPSPLSLSSDEDTSEIEEKSPEDAKEFTYGAEEDDSETLAVPEFTGLWNQVYKPYKVPKEVDTKPVGVSKMEKEIMAERLEKLRRGIIEKQVVTGREFKGCPFYSKPSLVHFKDLEVGKMYKKRITLTNASYAINSCKLLGVSEHLKDFITLQFDPPGQMSPGMSCEMSVIFKPMINEDLEGEVMLLANTGPFSIPIKCTTKKCELAVEKKMIDFGTHVIGETAIQTISLTNQGALGTRFSIREIISAIGADGAKTPLLPSLVEMTSLAAQERTQTYVDPSAQGHGDVLMSQQNETQRKEACSKSANYMETRSLKANGDVAEENIQEPSTQCAASLSEMKDMPSDVEEGVVEINLGEITEGEIGPFSSAKIPVVFTPLIPGNVRAQFEISFDNLSCKAITVMITGTSIDVPVYVPNSNIDLKICTYDRLYQESIIVCNRAKTALRLKFDVCKELKNHMELLPKTGFVQAQSSFSVQLKFLPTLSLPQDASTCFDKDTGVLEAPMTISVADQTLPVPFMVQAVLTSSDLEITPSELDFGYCSIYEAVQTSLQITNKSILPQEFGFVGIPEYVEVQPNDGFGTLLPMETVQLDVIFRAEKAKEYKFELPCKSAINRHFRVSCKAVGVHPPLQLSHSLVKFPATALNDVSFATLHVINSHTSRNEFTHPVPRIGNGDIPAVGPTSFEFHVSEHSPVTISPVVGTVLPGEKCQIQVSFKPSLPDQEIREEVMRILQRVSESKATMKHDDTLTKDKELQIKKERNKSGRKDKKTVSSPKNVTPQPTYSVPIELPKTEEIKANSDEYAAAKVSIYRRFTAKFESYVIPCFIVTGDTNKSHDMENFNFSPYNTLYLELHCPSIAPPIIVTSENGRHLIDFGEIAIGQRVIKRVTLQNISMDPVKLGFSILNPCGPFMLLNPVDVVDPGANCFLLIAFLPDENKIFFENLEVHCLQATLTLRIKGRGLTPSVSCSLDSDILDMGYILANDSSTTTFKLQNTSTVPVPFSIKLKSLSLSRYRDLQRLPCFISSHEKPLHLVGTQNFSGLSVFSVTPVEGTLLPEKSQDFTVTFSPDHESLHYSDLLTVELFSKLTTQTVELKGACRNHVMYVEGVDALDVSVESLGINLVDEGELNEPVNTVLLTLQCIQRETSAEPGVRELRVGCIRTSLLPTKKSVEFQWDNVQSLQQNGFTVEPVKGLVEPGQCKPISVLWVPPAGYDPMNDGKTTAKLTLKGDITEHYQVILVTKVLSA